jgi:uncharacterized RDD family membrane protein YckC
VAERAITPVPRDARFYQGRPAGLVSRFAAAAIDSLVVTLVQLLAYASWALLVFFLDPRNFSWPDPSLALGLALWFTILVVYLTLAWWLVGRTYGNLVMGLRVVARRGHRLRLATAMLRALLYAVFPIGLFWCATTRKNRSFQDIVLHTVVVYDWQPDVSTHEQSGETPAF